MLSNHLLLCHPVLLLPSILPSIRVFSSELALHFRWPTCWSFSFSISPYNEYAGLVSFRMDWFDLAVQGLVNAIHSSALTQNITSSGRPYNQASVTHPSSTTVFVSPSCCDKSPHTWWLRTTHLFPFGSEGQKSKFSLTELKLGCEQRWSLRKALRREPFPCFFQLLVTACLPWLVAPSPVFKAHHTTISAFIVTWPSLLILTLLPPSYRDSRVTSIMMI